MDPVYWFEISRKVLIAASIIAALGSIVAAAGGYGVLYFGRKVSINQELKIAKNNKKAAEAINNAAIADQNSAIANEKAAAAIKEVAIANSKAAIAEQKAAEVNQLAAEANSKAKFAEKRSLELEVHAKELTLQINNAKAEAENAKLERDRIKLETLELQEKSKNLEIETDALKKETRNNDEVRKQEIENIRKYTEISKMGVFGGKLTYIGKEKNLIKESSNIIDNMKNTLEPNGDKVKIIESKEAIEAAQKTIEIEPLFPFSYWVLAHNYAKLNDERWLENANKAIEILEETTKINGHKVHHDHVLKWLYNLKKQNGIKN